MSTPQKHVAADVYDLLIQTQSYYVFFFCFFFSLVLLLHFVDYNVCQIPILSA